MMVVKVQEGWKHMLGSLPVRKARIGVESGKNSGSIGNVRPCGESKVHQ